MLNWTIKSELHHRHSVRASSRPYDIPKSWLPIRRDIFSFDIPVNDGRGRGKHRRAESSINRGTGEKVWDYQCVLAPGSTGGGSRRGGSRPARDLEGIRNRGSVPTRGLTQSQNVGRSTRGGAHTAALHRGGYTAEPRESRSEPYARIPRERALVRYSCISV